MRSSVQNNKIVVGASLRETLLDLANLRDNHWLQFHRRYRGVYIPWPSDDELANWQLWLQRVWKGHNRSPDDHPNDPNAADDRDVRHALAAWVREATRDDRQTWVFDTSRPPYVVRPNYKNFPLSLAIGVCEMLSKMAVCPNPECPQPYFFKSRKTQRFCDRPACAAYGQREHKRKWWNDHGKEWRKDREAIKKKNRRK